MAEQFTRSPFAVRLPQSPSVPPQTLATSAWAAFIVMHATADTNEVSSNLKGESIIVPQHCPPRVCFRKAAFLFDNLGGRLPQLC